MKLVDKYKTIFRSAAAEKVLVYLVKPIQNAIRGWITYDTSANISYGNAKLAETINVSDDIWNSIQAASKQQTYVFKDDKYVVCNIDAYNNVAIITIYFAETVEDLDNKSSRNRIVLKLLPPQPVRPTLNGIRRIVRHKYA